MTPSRGPRRTPINKRADGQTRTDDQLFTKQLLYRSRLHQGLDQDPTTPNRVLRTVATRTPHPFERIADAAVQAVFQARRPALRPGTVTLGTLSGASHILHQALNRHHHCSHRRDDVADEAVVGGHRDVTLSCFAQLMYAPLNDVIGRCALGSKTNGNSVDHSLNSFAGLMRIEDGR